MARSSMGLVMALATLAVTVDAYAFAPSATAVRVVPRGARSIMAPRALRPRGSALRMGWGDDVVFSTAKVLSNEPAAEVRWSR